MRRWTCWTRSAACVRLCKLSQRAQSGSDPLRNAAQETRGMWHAACGMQHLPILVAKQEAICQSEVKGATRGLGTLLLAPTYVNQMVVTPTSPPATPPN